MVISDIGHSKISYGSPYFGHSRECHGNLCLRALQIISRKSLGFGIPMKFAATSGGEHFRESHGSLGA